jgi:uncharacterized protein YlxW (UPF0749 family)
MRQTLPKPATKPALSRNDSTNLSILIASVVLGFLLTVQFRSTITQLPVREQSRLATTSAVQRLEVEQRDLKQRLTELRGQLATSQHAAQDVGAEALVAAGIDQQKLLSGMTPLHGPGLLLTLEDSTRAMPAADDANNLIIHDYELRDVVSLLWLAGAEAISINDERLVSVSSIYCVGSTILVNDTRLSPPYEIRALGDAAGLEQAANNSKNLAKLKASAKTYGIQLRVAAQKDVTIPAYNGNLNIRYARPAAIPGRQQR